MKMMPGQEPYASAEEEQLAQLVRDAAEGDPGEDAELDAIAEWKAYRDAEEVRDGR